MISKILTNATFALFTLIAFNSQAGDVPAGINYQGYLTSAAGVPLDGTVDMALGVWSDASSTTPVDLLYRETHTGVTVSGGLFKVVIGTGTPTKGTFDADLFSEPDRWIEVETNSEVLSPRQAMLSVPYAMQVAPAGTSGAITYTRWGRSDCPAGATVLYSGHAAGSFYQQTGSGGNLICLNTPTYDDFSDASENGGLVYVARYVTSGFGLASFAGLHLKIMPCAVCMRDGPKVTFVNYGSSTCPGGTKTEYPGYLMSAFYTHTKADYTCVDQGATSTDTSPQSFGQLMYPVEYESNGAGIPGYVQNRELTCSVCSR